MLSVQGLCVRYRKSVALQDVTFSLQAGQWLMVAGPNGAGKSTLLKAIAQTVPSSGSIALSGKDARRLPPRAFARLAATLPQQNPLGGAFKVREVVALGRYSHRGFFSSGDPGGGEKIGEALAFCGLAGMEERSILTLSGGELQRVFLARVFAQDAPLLLLDEPASHLDLAYLRGVFDLVSRWLQTPGRAVLSVVHDLQLARRYGSHALLMDHGRVKAFGAADDALDAGNLRAVYQMDVPAWFDWLYAPWRSVDKPAP